MTIRINDTVVSGVQVDSVLANSNNAIANIAVNTYLNNNTTLTTTNKTVQGAINEINANKVGRLTAMPTAAATYADGQIYQYVGVTTTTVPIYNHGSFYECKETETAGVYEWKEVIGGGGGTWGSISGTLSDQTDLQDALDDKQDLIVYSDTQPTGTVEGRLWITGDDDVAHRSLEQLAVDDRYNPTSTYNIGDTCSNQGYWWTCNTNGTTGVWDVSKWTQTKIKEYISPTKIVNAPAGNYSGDIKVFRMGNMRLLEFCGVLFTNVNLFTLEDIDKPVFSPTAIHSTLMSSDGRALLQIGSGTVEGRGNVGLHFATGSTPYFGSITYMTK